MQQAYEKTLGLTLWSRRRGRIARVTRIVGVEPIFAVSDMPRAAEHYARLGFEISYHDEGYVFAQRQGLNLHLDLTDAPAPGGGLLYLHVDDADQLTAEWRAAGVEVVEPQDFPWGKHEGSHTDPDGNTIRFGSPLRG
jgi:uncharacterized glyoxalase superfamily protein PhnB